VHGRLSAFRNLVSNGKPSVGAAFFLAGSLFCALGIAQHLS
jgi:hypothetical protein